jgi:hypothetical protein
MDVYLNTRRDLLIVKKGSPIPPIAPPGKWRKSKKRVVKVSEEIRSALQTQGYYMRKMRDLHRVNVKLIALIQRAPLRPPWQRMVTIGPSCKANFGLLAFFIPRSSGSGPEIKPSAMTRPGLGVIESQ